MTNISTMTKNYFSLLILVLLGSLTLTCTSCSDDDDDNGYANGDFLEVTINGKTYHKEVPFPLYGQYPVNDGDELYATTIPMELFEEDGFDFEINICHYENLNQLLKCKPGEYGIYNLYEYSGNGGYNYKNLDLSTSFLYLGGDGYWDSHSGTHTVTSIKEVKDGAVVEGKFNIKMCSDTAKDTQISGKYRITLDLVKF